MITTLLSVLVLVAAVLVVPAVVAYGRLEARRARRASARVDAYLDEQQRARDDAELARIAEASADAVAALAGATRVPRLYLGTDGTGDPRTVLLAAAVEEADGTVIPGTTYPPRLVEWSTPADPSVESFAESFAEAWARALEASVAAHPAGRRA